MPFLSNQAETGMGFWVCTVELCDGRLFDRVVIVGGVFTQVAGSGDVPFTEEQIAHIRVTHEDWRR